jgi:AraC-like DNA-binding protein
MKITTAHFAVPADLQPYLDSFWFMESDGAPNEISPFQYCLANGSAEMIIHVAPPFTHSGYMNGRLRDFPEAFLGGIHVEPVLFQIAGNTGMFGISCKPEAIYSLFKKPISELVDDFAEMRAFFGKGIGDLVERIQGAPSNDHRVQIATAFFRQRVAMQQQSERFYLSEAMQYIRKASGQHSVDEVCGKVFVGKRQLQRSFQDNIGISPKTYGRIIRFKGVYDFVQNNPKASWTQISHDFGYTDQSHFIRDFKSFTGKKPTSFMSGFAPQDRTPFALSA